MNSFWPNPGLPGALVLAFLFLARIVAAVEPLEEIIEQKYAVDPQVTLSVHNVDGSIRVYAAEVKEIRIEAIKRAYTADRLQQIAVSVKASPESIEIETFFPPKKNGLSLRDRSGTVEYNLIVPQTTRVTNLDLVNGEVFVENLRGGGSAAAHIVNGWIAAHNCFGDLNLRIDNGRLDVAYGWWENTKFNVKLTSDHGNIRAVIPSDASAEITARTETGRIANAFDPKPQLGSEVMRSLNFAIEPNPESVFALSSTNGNIRIEKSY